MGAPGPPGGPPPGPRPGGNARPALAERQGRAQELRAVESAVARLAERQGGVVAVVGPSGVGKSRIAREAAALAAVRNATVLTGRAVATGSSTPYRPLIEALAPWGRTPAAT